MKNRWVQEKADEQVKTTSGRCGNELALLTYATRLAGGEPGLALHGGGNTSIKTTHTTLVGDVVSALVVKASGFSMNAITPDGFVYLDQVYLKKMCAIPGMTDSLMADEFRTHLLHPSCFLPSVETLMHAFLEPTCIVHTHPSAILCLTNRKNAEQALYDAFKDSVAVIPYQNAGLALGKAVAGVYEKNRKISAIIVSHHGLVTWGATPKEAYDTTIEIVSRAEEYIRSKRGTSVAVKTGIALADAWKRYDEIAPMLRGLLSPQSGDGDNPQVKMALSPLITEDMLGLLAAESAGELSCSTPLTPDYLVRTKTKPLFIENPGYADVNALKTQIQNGITAFESEYRAYRATNAGRLPDADMMQLDCLPRVVVLPGLGVVCAAPTIEQAKKARDITEQYFSVKKDIIETNGTYLGLSDAHLFDMEHRAFQRAKVDDKNALPLAGSVAIVTGSAGAIGTGICEELLAQGSCVAITDLPGDTLDVLVKNFKGSFGDRVLGLALDVTDGASVAAAFTDTIRAFGGIDIVVINAGLAHVSPLTEMNLDEFRKLERVNVEGTLLLLGEAGRMFKKQNTGGDVVLISTKNVFAPGAKFGAYSATKASAHQLCRIASLEFADMKVRVNMVAPDAVFSHGKTKSGLWASVGPDRMKARGLDEQGLEDYYRQRNLLKSTITARHVAKAVMFFVTHQTPTTGATIPVDGGLPDATPR